MIYVCQTINPSEVTKEILFKKFIWKDSSKSWFHVSIKTLTPYQIRDRARTLQKYYEILFLFCFHIEH